MTTDVINEISEKLVKAGKELHELGLVRGTSGNISARIPGTDTFLIKPSGAKMWDLKPNELMLVDTFGNKIRGEGKVSLETPIHAAIYSIRGNVQAVVHTHPPIATAFGIAKQEIVPLQIEIFAFLQKGVPIISFETPGSKALAVLVQEKIVDYEAIILENHGIITVGSTIEEACSLNEMVEESAKIQFVSKMLGARDSINLLNLRKEFKPKNILK